MKLFCGIMSLVMLLGALFCLYVLTGIESGAFPVGDGSPEAYRLAMALMVTLFAVSLIEAVAFAIASGKA